MARAHSLAIAPSAVPLPISSSGRRGCDLDPSTCAGTPQPSNSRRAYLPPARPIATPAAAGAGTGGSWRVVDETTWEFKLRRGVGLHDGSGFTAEDVAYTIGRPRHRKHSRRSRYSAADQGDGRVIRTPVQFRATSPTPIFSTCRCCTCCRENGAELGKRRFRFGQGGYWAPVPSRPVHQGRPHRPRAARRILEPKPSLGPPRDIRLSPTTLRASPRCWRATFT